METVLPASSAPAVPLQRRYSVTGQTPPDDVGAVKSPKLQALDTSVQTAGCNLCESGDAGTCGRRRLLEAPHQEERAHTQAGRTSAKRSATQLPSPSTPSSLELPTKIARLGLQHHDMDLDGPEDSLSGPCPEEESDWALSACGDSPPTSFYSMTDCECASEAEESQSKYFDVLDVPLPSLDDRTALSLCTLPPELRHQIYLKLPDLVLPYPLIYCLSTFANQKQHPLASVSRLIRSEALAIFYSYNTWIIKLEFNIMYDAFQQWIIRVADGSSSLRLIKIAVRGSLFKPRTSHGTTTPANMPLTLALNGFPVNAQAPAEAYHPPDGDASFGIDLSEKWTGGRVELLRNDGTWEAGESARIYLAKLVEGLWQKRRTGTLNAQDWVTMVDRFLEFIGWRYS
ncbi:hypothetical protein K491DRAFT_90036 [Lophiostoma macrostomum CBS 122681]|uniref:F-box domain-containing protein n=1 Tax=Lophiostoma macrostomum CBS 122681 TaxID=1314788 RepID=A0A6A6SWX0_9PLEO|nr:hypothetical protein K491DRAFT_90036 [Lophiostoma macrostomum CBS 122681]